MTFSWTGYRICLMGRGGLSTALSILLLAIAPFWTNSAVTFAQTEAEAGSEPRLVDRIVAIVDEEAILQSDLEREIELYKLEKEYAGDKVEEVTPVVMREMLERLIESKLIIAAAKQADMTVDEEAIRESVDLKIQQFIEHFGSMDALKRELLRSGMTLEDYRARMATQLRDQQFMRLVVGKFIRPKVEVLENEVRDYYLAHLEEMPAEQDSLTIADILIPVQPSLEVRQKIQTIVLAVNTGLDQGVAFAELAKQYSQGPSAARGGTIGTVSPGDLFDENLDRVAFALKPGQISDPVITSRGVHLLKLTALGENGKRTLSQIFIPITISQQDIDLALAEIEKAKERVLNGEAFSLVASEVSGDALSANQGGALGTFGLEDLSPQFQEALAEAAIGQITEPILTPAGWYIFLVQDRKEGHLFTYEELREELRQVVEGMEIETALADYVEGLRERFFIDEKN
ncbi:MAG: peptidylprolyl isomerase [Gemmatimonadales bacterium]|nr:peptidylprolyl isomerase [Gemmatimonadales bacterium]